MSQVVVVHDYLTQRGGAERVALELVRAFPGSRLVTSVYDPDATFPEFADIDIAELGLGRVPGVRTDVRRALPLLAPMFSARRVDAEVVLCSSSGWAHGIGTGRGATKVVYCHTPARWLYEPDDYLGADPPRGRQLALAALAPGLRAWDQHAARSAARYIANSTTVADRIERAYGIVASVVAPPPAVTGEGERRAVAGLPERFALCVARLLPYKHVVEVVEGCRLAGLPVVVVGEGPLVDTVDATLAAGADGSTRLSRVTDAELRWLYGRAELLVAGAHEDLGLTPLEAAACGTPTAALRRGGYLDTVVDGETGNWIAEPTPPAIARAVRAVLAQSWSSDALVAHAEGFAAARFRDAIRAEVDAALLMG